MAVTLNASTSTGYIQTADTSGDLALQSNGTTQFTVSSTGAYGQLKSGTAATASGSSVDFTSIPSWAKRITVMFSGVSFAAAPTGYTFIQLGTGATPTYTTSGYGSSIATCSASATSTSNQTSGFGVLNPNSSTVLYGGVCVLTNLSGNVWACTGSACDASASRVYLAAGTVTLAAALTAVRLNAGADTFDAGTINILYEG